MRRPLNVHTVLNRYQPGGAERIAFDLLEGLDPERFRQRLVLLESGNEGVEKLDAGVERVSLGKSRRLDSLWLPWRLASLLRKDDCDVVVAHLPFASIVSVFARLVGARRCGVIAVHHSMGSEYEPGSLREGFYRILGRWAFRSADAVVAVHPGVEAHLREFYLAPDLDCVTILNGVDRERISRLASRAGRRALGMDEGRLIFVSAGRLAQEKGHAVLVEAFLRMLPYLPEAQLVIVGDGDERERLEQAAAPAGEAIRFVGHQDDPYPYLAAADAFVLPSLWEGLPIALLEAMSLGRPIVGSDLPAVAEVIRGAGAGIVVPPGDADALAAAMLRMATDTSARAAYGFEARRAAAGYDARTMLDRYATLIDSVASRRRGPAAMERAIGEA